MKKQFKYYTFISYKHEQKANGKFTTDEKWAHIFKSHLESWEIPAHIPSQERLNEEDERIYPVFRDSENYPVSGELNQLTHKSLSESKTLLVILSREMLEDQFKLRYKHGANAWIFNEIESFIDLGNNSESIILFYVGDDDINPNELLKEMIELCENKGIECKALKYMYQPNKIIKRLRDFKDKGNEIEHYATAVVAAGIFNTDPYFFIDAYELAERKKKIVSQKEFTMENGYKYQIFDSESVFLISVPSVSEVAIPNIVEYEGFKFDVIGIGEGAFYGTSLESLFIPQSIQHILCDTLLAFQDSLQKIIVEPGNLKYDSRNNCNAIIETKTNSFLFGCKTSVIPEGIISIAPKAFEHCTLLKSINIPASVKEIGAGAFKNCINLTSISIPDNITRIEDNTFYGCI